MSLLYLIALEKCMKQYVTETDSTVKEIHLQNKRKATSTEKTQHILRSNGFGCLMLVGKN